MYINFSFGAVLDKGTHRGLTLVVPLLRADLDIIERRRISDARLRAKEGSPSCDRNSFFSPLSKSNGVHLVF